jgi:hypothetical protein
MCRFFVTPSTKMRATRFRRSPHLCCKASSKLPQLSPRDLSKTVGRNTEARREWNGVVSTKNMRQIESKESQKKTTCRLKNAFPLLFAGGSVRQAGSMVQQLHVEVLATNFAESCSSRAGGRLPPMTKHFLHEPTHNTIFHSPRAFLHCKEWRPSFSVSRVCYSLSSIM